MLRPQNVKRIVITVNPNTFHLLPNQHRIKTQNRSTVNLWPRKSTSRLRNNQYHWLIPVLLTSFLLASDISAVLSPTLTQSQAAEGTELAEQPHSLSSSPKILSSPNASPHPEFPDFPLSFCHTVTVKCSLPVLPHKLHERNQSCYNQI